MADQSITIEGILYKLFKNSNGLSVVQVIDVDSKEVVSHCIFKTEAKAGAIYDETVRAATACSIEN